MPIQAPHWTDYLNCPVCFREYGLSPRSPVSLGCGHTLCENCLRQLNRKICPFDQTVILGEIEDLPVNTALLQLAGYSTPLRRVHPPQIQDLPEIDRNAYDVIVTCLEQLAVFLKSCANTGGNNKLSRPMQRKLVTLIQCAIRDEEGRGKAARAARSLGERTVTELILQHQNPQQLGANLWAAVRARGCQFLGPGMQEEVLKLILLALEDNSYLSRKVIVMFVVQRLERSYPQASKTSIGHVVQLLYRASCFRVSKRECDSSLMQLKEEFRSYETLRREHDAQIVQIATEAGLRIAPEQWSSLLYGDTCHKSHMQSIIDKLQTPQSFSQSLQELFIALQRSGDSCHPVVMSLPLERLANIDPRLDANCPSWQALADIMMAVRDVVSGLVNYLQHQVVAREAKQNPKHIQNRPDLNSRQLSPQSSPPQRFNIAACRDSDMRLGCPGGNSCSYAHFDDMEMERFKPTPPGHISNGRVIGYSPVAPMHVQRISPPFPMENHVRYQPPFRQAPMRGRVLVQHSEGYNPCPSTHMHGMPPPMMRRADAGGPVNYEVNGDSLNNHQLPSMNDMGGNIGVAQNTTLTIPDSNIPHVPPPTYVHSPRAPGGPYGGGVMMNPVSMNHNNLLMPVTERPYYGGYPGMVGVVAEEAPSNFYPGQETYHYQQYARPAYIHTMVPVQHEPDYVYNGSPENYILSQPPNPMGPLPEYLVSQESPYAFNNIAVGLPSDSREPPGFPSRAYEPHIDPYWLRSSAFEFEDMTEALGSVFHVPTPPEPENAQIPEDMRVVGANRNLGAERPPPPPPPPLPVDPTNESDEYTLEEEMMALERRLKTEYKIA